MRLVYKYNRAISSSHTSRITGSMAFLFFLIWTFSMQAAEEVNLQMCREWAYNNYPLIHKYKLIEKTRDFKLSNIKKAYLPQGSFNAQSTWQSEVTNIPITLPGVDIPNLSKDQYRVQLEINQLIYDGGRIKDGKSVINKQMDVEGQQWDVNMYSVYERVDELYFGILLLKEQLALNNILQEDLERNLALVNNCRLLGIATETDEEEVRVSLLDAQQQYISLDYALNRTCEMLDFLTGANIHKDIRFMRPSGVMPQSWQNTRPELNLFEAGERLIQSRSKQLNSANMPVFSAFMQGIYGRPGFNMLRNDFDWGYLIGIRMSYSFGNLYTLKKDRLLLENERLQLQNERNVFLFNTNLELDGLQQQLKGILELMRRDDEIIRMRRNIVKASEVRLQNGTILVNDLLRDISSENRAMLQKVIHEIESLQIIWKMKLLVNHE